MHARARALERKERDGARAKREEEKTASEHLNGPGSRAASTRSVAASTCTVLREHEVEDVSKRDLGILPE